MFAKHDHYHDVNRRIFAHTKLLFNSGEYLRGESIEIFLKCDMSSRYSVENQVVVFAFNRHK
jgi:hypothetical protein